MEHSAVSTGSLHSSTARGARRRVTAMSLCMRVLRASTWRSVAASASSSASAASACGGRRRCAFAHGGPSSSTGNTVVAVCLSERTGDNQHALSHCATERGQQLCTTY